MDHEKMHEMQMADMSMKWYGWGSPIGLSIFFLALVAVVVIIKIFFFA